MLKKTRDSCQQVKLKKAQNAKNIPKWALCIMECVFYGDTLDK